MKQDMPFGHLNQLAFFHLAVRCLLFLTLLITLYSPFVAVESSQKMSSSEIPKISEELKNEEKKLEGIEKGDKGLSKLWSNLTEMNRKVSYTS